jgi:uncharacterized damage-inducible protein DinB
MVSWRKALLGRVTDKPVSVPGNNYISVIKNTSPKAWKQAIKNFESSQRKIEKFLASSDDRMLEKVSPTSGYLYYELLTFVLVHDTYHLGQIVMLKKMLGKKMK